MPYFFSIDGTGERKLIVYANDSSDKDANCVARNINTVCGTHGPFIVTKRDIRENEELTYSYGDYPYEWRTSAEDAKSEQDLISDQGRAITLCNHVPLLYIKVFYVKKHLSSDVERPPEKKKKKYHTGANHRFVN